MTHEVLDIAGKVAVLTGKVGAPYVTVAVTAAKLLADFINRERKESEQAIVLDELVIREFVESAQLGAAESRAILDRWRT